MMPHSKGPIEAIFGGSTRNYNAPAASLAGDNHPRCTMVQRVDLLVSLRHFGTRMIFLGPAHLGEFTRLSAPLLKDDRLMGREDVVADRRVR
jgi:hypothetical protein